MKRVNTNEQQTDASDQMYNTCFFFRYAVIYYPDRKTSVKS